MSTQDGSRWDLYVLHRQQELHEQWQARFADGARVALIMGVGFDPRMCMVLRMFGELADVDRVAVHAVRFGAPGDVTARVMAEENLAEFDRLLGGRPVSELTVAGDDLDATARSGAAAVQSLDALGHVSDIVVDINALPRAVFFPLVIAVGTAVTNGPPHRSQHARQRTGLFPWVLASKRTFGQG